MFLLYVADQDFTRRAIASEASRTFSAAVSPPWATASATQCSRWSSSRPSATDCSALLTADTWVRMSMQYLSSSTIRCRPRTCPSIRRSRFRYSSLSGVYPYTPPPPSPQLPSRPATNTVPPQGISALRAGVQAGSWPPRDQPRLQRRVHLRPDGLGRGGLRWPVPAQRAVRPAV